jgi:hypothetical protein
MSSIAGIFAATGPVTVAMTESARARLGSTARSGSSGASSTHYADLATIHRRMSELGRALDEAHEVFESLRVGGTRTSAAGAGAATSASALGIDPNPSSSTLDSTEEVNTVPTSYTPFGPSWTGASTSLVTIGGTYDGSQGDDTLRFRVTSRNGTVGGGRDINLRIYDQGGTKVMENISFGAGTPAETPISLSNGLTVSLGTGDVLRNDEFTVSIYTTIDSEVDPDLAFDGTRNDDPNLEPGLPITAGSFTVNGEIISVATDDTINTVLDRINASDAGVTAIYDPTTELVSFEADATGAEDIVLADDSSGFLDSMKLSGATVVPGREGGEQDVVMQQVDALSGTTAGSITINGVDIAIDPSTDSLEDVMAAINASEAGVTASFDTDALEVTITANSSSGSVELQDGGTNFTAAIAIAEGSYDGVTTNRSAKLSKIMARRATRALENVTEAFERLRATELSDSRAQTVLNNAVSSIEGAITTALGDSESTFTDAGLSLDTDAEAGQALMDLTNHLFERSLRSSDAGELKGALVGSLTRNDDGLLGLMDAAVDQLEESLRRRTGDVGVYLSTYA